MAPDDIPLDTTTSETERSDPQRDKGSRPKVGPESEVRGGSEAVSEGLDEAKDEA